MTTDFGNGTIRRICAVTGATGFIGTYVSKNLLGQGWTLVQMRRGSVDFSKISTIVDFLRENCISDILHLGGLSNPTDGDLTGFYQSNAFETDRLLRAAVDVGLRGRFVLASASSVYGDTGNFAATEETPPNPNNHYAASKLLAEVYAHWYRPQIDIAIARISNCIGVGQRENYLVPKLVDAFSRRLDTIVLGNTRVARDFLDVRDSADIIARILSAPPRSVWKINVSSGHATSISDLIGLLSSLTSHSPVILVDETLKRTGDIEYQVCSNELARKLGYTPSYSLAESLRWMLSLSESSRRQS